jgi:hypothetical protein
MMHLLIKITAVAIIAACLLVSEAPCEDQFTLLTQLSDQTDAETVLDVFDGKLWIGVLKTDATLGAVPHTYTYDGSNVALRGQINGLTDKHVNDFQDYNGQLYCSVDYYGYVYQHNAGSWQLVITPPDLSGDVYETKLGTYSGNLIIGSQFYGKVFTWDTAAVTKMGRLFSGLADPMSNFIVFNSELWGGNGNWSQVHRYGGETDETTWADRTAIFGGYRDADVTAFALYENTLCAASDCAGTTDARVYQYDGSSWSLLGSLPDVTGNIDLVVYNGKLYASGDYHSRVYVFNNGTWLLVDELSQDNKNAVDLEVYNGKLYAGLEKYGAVYEYSDNIISDNNLELLPDGTIQLQWNASTPALFSIQYKNSLQESEWSVAEPIVYGKPGLNSWLDDGTNTGNSPVNGTVAMRFYRIEQLNQNILGSDNFDLNQQISPTATTMTSDYLDKIQNISSSDMVYVPRVTFYPFMDIEDPYIYHDSFSNRVPKFYRRTGTFWLYRIPMMQNIHAKLSMRLEGGYTVLASNDDSSYSQIASYISNPEQMDELDVSSFFNSSDTLYLQPKNATLRYMWLKVGVEDLNSNGISDIVEEIFDYNMPVSSDTENYSTFITSASWEKWYSPARDMCTDELMLSMGTDATDAALAQSWRDEGEYNFVVRQGKYYGYPTTTDYLDGTFDGSTHYDEIEIDASSNQKHILTTTNWQNYLNEEVLKPILDMGIDGINLEEAFVYSNTGYSDAFKDEYQAFHGSAWVNPISSINARYNCEKVRAHLWENTIPNTADFVHDYGDTIGTNPLFITAQHSPINYRQWGLVFPFKTFLTDKLDRLYAWVWSDTTRQNITYRGATGTRVIDYGFLEYSYFSNFGRDQSYETWFIHDPASDVVGVEDRQWPEYQDWYERTVIASLLFPDITRFVLTPWPERVFTWENTYTGFCPQDYMMEILNVFRACEDMHNQTEVERNYQGCSIGIPVADSMMWQTNPSGNTLTSFTGLALPLLNKGIPVEIFPLERSTESGYLDFYDVIILSYDMFKPLEQAYNTAIADWVKAGGVLILFEGGDAYNNVSEWWQSAGYSSPANHLLSELGALPISSPTTASISSGVLYYEATAPSIFATNSSQADRLISIVQNTIEGHTSYAYDAPGNLVLSRGDYTIAYASELPCELSGKYLNILDPDLVIDNDPTVAVGEYRLYKTVPDTTTIPLLLATNSQAKYTKEQADKTTVMVSGPLGTLGIAKFISHTKVPTEFHVYNQLGEELPIEWQWDVLNQVLSLKYNHSPWGDIISIIWE